jgi:hypothetical protein
MRALISLALAAGLGAATLMATPQMAAAANPYPWHPYPHHYRHHHNNNAGAFVAGSVFGLALGGLGNWGYRAYPAYPAYQYPAYGNGNWNAHVAYCSARFHSYNPSTNLYLTYHNGWQPCHSPYGW